MANLADPMFQHDIERRLRDVELAVRGLQTARRLEAATIGRGGLRVHGGQVTALDLADDLVFQVTTDPASIFLRQELITDVAVKIFADRIVSDVVNANESTSSSTFTDLATVGPTVSVEISETGLAVVFLSSRIGNDAGAGDNIIWGFMDFDVSGATTRAATFETSLSLIANSADLSSGYAIRAGIHSPITVNPGLNTFKAKYSNGGGLDPAYFDDRRIMVIGF